MKDTQFHYIGLAGNSQSFHTPVGLLGVAGRPLFTLHAMASMQPIHPIYIAIAIGLARIAVKCAFVLVV